MDVEISYLPVLVAAIINMAIGFLWYGPLFGKKWLALSGVSMDQINAGQKQGMTKTYILSFVGSLLLGCVLFRFIAYASGFLQQSGVSLGIMVAFWAWLGFIVPVVLSSVLWEKKSWSLFCLNAAYYLVSFLVLGAVLAAWM